MPTTAELLQELDAEAEGTRRVLERVPGDRLDWRPHEKSMSMGQLAMHLAGLPRIVGIVQQPSFDVGTPVPLPEPDSIDQILATFDESLEFARAQLRAMDDATLGEPWRMMHGERELFTTTKGDVLRSVLLNHSYHHRGQLTVYLRLTDVPVPAVYGISADESPFGV